MALPVLAEVIFDKYRWSKGLDDKPISTYLRYGSFVLIAVIFDLVGLSSIYQAFILTFATHLLFFNPIIHKVLGYGWFYQKEGELWTKFAYFEIPAKLIIYYSAWATYFHFDWLQGDYPARMFEFFMY